MAKVSPLKGWGVDDHNVSPEEVTRRLERLVKKNVAARKKMPAKPKKKSRRLSQVSS